MLTILKFSTSVLTNYEREAGAACSCASVGCLVRFEIVALGMLSDDDEAVVVCKKIPDAGMYVIRG